MIYPDGKKMGNGFPMLNFMMIGDAAGLIDLTRGVGMKMLVFSFLNKRRSGEK